ncbi:MAG: hypothetical protein K5697_17325 [Lachnospiraceae bacterium]|nr:hypothetical protein [Lachnospiraceae bacterium]
MSDDKKDKEIPFYLGERIVKEEEKKEDEDRLRISYGGAMPEQLEKYRPRQRTNEELAQARVLMQKYEKKQMLNRRILYLERRRLFLVTNMQSSDRRRRGKGFFSLFSNKKSTRYHEWERELCEIFVEHEQLEREKAELVKEIRAMEKRGESDG